MIFRRRTRQRMHAVLAAWADGLDGELDGLDIADRTGLLPGTTWPILQRLQQAGYVTSWWETMADGRPRRRVYRITNAGVRHAQRSGTLTGARVLDPYQRLADA